jgi:molybdenum cofactor cytidylyltransferase
VKEKSNIAIIILAAGGSSRMGSPKQLLAWGGTTLIEHTIDQAEQSEINDIYIVLGAKCEEIRSQIAASNCTIIISDHWQSGLGHSLASGMKHLQRSTKCYDGVLVMLADQPEVDSAYLNKLMSEFHIDKKQIMATAYGNKIGVPAIFDEIYYEQLSALTGDDGAKKIIRKNLANVTTLSPKTSFIDIDTKENYDQYHSEFFGRQ